MKSEPIMFSIVVPVYNSQDSLEELCFRIQKVFETMNRTYEIVLIDDSSRDNSWNVMISLREKNNKIKIIQLMKNFGQHNALLCGFNHVSGDYVITMDDDLQNPPEDIPKLVNKLISSHYDAVIGKPDTKKDKLYKTFGSFLIDYLNYKIFRKPSEIKLSSFRIMTRSLTEHIKTIKTPYPYISGMMLSVSKNIGNVTVNHAKRKYGRSTYSFSKLIKLALNLIINYTAFPLRFLAGCGIMVSFLSFCMGLFFAVKRLLTDSIFPGWTSIVVILSFFNGLLLCILSLMGEYLARILGEVSNKKQFVVRQKKI